MWATIPEVYQDQAKFYTDQYEVYNGVIPADRHKAITKKARKTNHIERFNNTLRQRLARLVRDTLSFSKKVQNHIGAIKFFICHYNLEKAGALPVYSILKFFQVDSTGMCRMTSSARYFK